MVEKGGNGVNQSNGHFVHLVEDEERMRTSFYPVHDLLLNELTIGGLLRFIRTPVWDGGKGGNKGMKIISKKEITLTFEERCTRGKKVMFMKSKGTLKIPIKHPVKCKVEMKCLTYLLFMPS